MRNISKRYAIVQCMPTRANYIKLEPQEVGPSITKSSSAMQKVSNP